MRKKVSIVVLFVMLCSFALSMSACVDFDSTFDNTLDEPSNKITLTCSDKYYIGKESIALNIAYSGFTVEEQQTAIIKFDSMSVLPNVTDNKFSAQKMGNVTFYVQIGDTISNSVTISCLFDAQSISELIKEIDFTKLRAGHAYTLFENLPLEIETADEGIFELENGCLNVVGLGKGTLKIFNSETQDVYFDDQYIVYNSIISTEIRTQLYEKNIIKNKKENISKDKLLFIEELDLSNVLINDNSIVEELKLLKGIKRLWLASNNLKSVDFIKDLVALEQLDLSHNQIEDITALKKLSLMEELNLKNNKLEDIESLKFLDSLEYLDISNNKVDNLNPVSTLFEIKALYLNGNNFDNKTIDSISGLDNIVKLGVGNLKINSDTIYALKYFSNLEYLDLSNSAIDLKYIPKTDRMKELILSDCNLKEKSLKTLNDFNSLKILDISNNGLNLDSFDTYLSNVKEANELIDLRLGGNEFVSLPNFSALDKLKSLDLTGTKNLREVDNLSTADKIEYLYLDGCTNIAITEYMFSSLVTGFTELTHLSLIEGLNFMDRGMYDFVMSRLQNNGLAIRLLGEKWVDRNSVMNYNSMVYFTLDEFLASMEVVGNNIYKIKYIPAQRNMILNFRYSTEIRRAKIQIPADLFAMTIYGNKYHTFNLSFDILDRRESSVSFNLVSFNTVGEFSSYAGSLLKIDNSGKSSVTALPQKYAFNVYDVEFTCSDNVNSLLTINGASGTKGEDGVPGKTSPASRRGGNGMEGFAAVSCNLVVFKSFRITLIGGSGGNGGNGGDSKNAGMDMGENCDGGNGGNGGIGGVAVKYKEKVVNDVGATLTGGNGGTGGSGGNHGTAWFGAGKNGKKGSDGLPGNPFEKIS